MGITFEVGQKCSNVYLELFSVKIRGKLRPFSLQSITGSPDLRHKIHKASDTVRRFLMDFILLNLAHGEN